MGIVKLKELLDLEKVSELLRSFYKSTGFGIGLISKDGEVLVKSSWQPICEDFHRRNPESLKNCLESDQRIDKELKDVEFVDYKCLNGLVDAAIPLIIDGEHLASLFFGQFFYEGEEGSEEEFRARAREFGFPEEEYIEAYKQIPVYSREQVAEIIRFCGTLVNFLTEMGKKNLNLKVELEVKQKYERQLKLSESRYRTLLETASDPVFAIDRQGRYVFLNQEAAWQLGGEPEDFMGKMMTEFFPPEIGKRQLASIQKVIDKKEGITTETRTMINDKERWYSMHINPVTGDDGKVTYAQSIARDITDLKIAQKRIAEQNQFLESIYSGTSVAIFVLDVTEDGQFIYRGLNPAHERTSGFKSEQLEGKTPDEITDLIPPEAIGVIKKRYQSCLDADDVVSYEEMIPMLDKNIWWFTTLTPIRDEKGNIYRIIGSALDITDLKETQQELEDHKQHLEEMVAQQTEELKASNEQLLDEIEERRVIEEDRARLLLQTQERVKEMYCLNSINALLDVDDIDLKQVCKQIVDLIPPAWFYPDHTWCQLQIGDEVYESEGFRKTDYSHKIMIYRNEEKAGELEVFLDQGEDREFLNEELSLLNNIGISISNTLTKMAIQKRLKEVKLAMEYGQNGFAMGDLNGIIYEVNKAFLSMWGADSEEDVLGKLYSDLLADKQKAKSIIEGIMTQGFWKGEITALRLDGSEFEINIAANLVYDEKGNVIALAASFEDITERNKLVRELRENEERYRRIFESVTDAIFICDLTGRFVEANQAASEIYGYSKEEFLMRSPKDLVHPDYSDVLNDFFAAVNQDRLFKGETIDIRKDGSFVNTAVTGRKLIYKGKPHLMAVVHDLTDLKMAQGQVDNFFNNTLSLLCIAGTDGYFKKINPAWEDLLGYSQEELLAKPFLDFTHPDDVELTLKEVEKLSQGAATINFTNRYKSKDGSYKWLNWTSVPVGDVLYGAAVDITEIKEAEKKLKAEKEFTETAVNSLPGVFYILDEQARFVRWNSNFPAITGYTDEEMSKLNALSLFSQFEQEYISRAINEVFNSGEAKVEGNIITKSGEDIPFYFTGYRIEISGVTYLLGTGIDISELKSAQAKLQEIMADLERSNKDLEDFAYVASHDLQEPLRKTASFTQLLANKYHDQLDERAQKYMHYITDGTERMQGLITGLLKFSRVSTRGREFTKVNMQEVVNTTISNLSLMIKDNEAVIDCGKMPVVMADESQILSVIQNLISNALKFKADRKPQIKIRAKSNKNDWLFSVSDNGIGINEEFAEKIFIIFQRLHNRDQYPGSGIGLAVVKKIVERHGGKIWFESTPGEGTTFCFTLKKEGR